MLRITPKTDNGSPTLKLEGRIGGPWVDELRESWSAVAKTKKSVKVDMRGVSYVDRAGAELLLEMEDAGVSLMHCSDFIQQQVHADRGSKERARRISK